MMERMKKKIKLLIECKMREKDIKDDLTSGGHDGGTVGSVKIKVG